ncbi:MAG: hypothetical protein GW942_02525 [Candidatus Pacebacteria bacterium]|nr:hypothetical protein [Candidatus Paceibacterota bacterium]
MDIHQKKQIDVINQIEERINSNNINFTTVPPVEDYVSDNRICLTSVHFPKVNLLNQVSEIIAELKKVEPNYYHYDNDSLHMTIKNIKVINNPPLFSEDDIHKVKNVFSKIIPAHKKYKVFFYRLLLLPNNLALIGTTEPELDSIVNDLDEQLKKVGVPDDKSYLNTKYFFSNMTLTRFEFASEKFKNKIRELSDTLIFKPYEVDKVSLVTSNAVLKKKKIIDTWSFK